MKNDTFIALWIATLNTIVGARKYMVSRACYKKKKEPEKKLFKSGINKPTNEVAWNFYSPMLSSNLVMKRPTFSCCLHLLIVCWYACHAPLMSHITLLATYSTGTSYEIIRKHLTLPRVSNEETLPKCERQQNAGHLGHTSLLKNKMMRSNFFCCCSLKLSPLLGDTQMQM